MREIAPKDTGDLARSLRVERYQRAGNIGYRIVSDDPNIKDILNGRRPNSGMPAWKPGTPLGGWASRHGFATRTSQYMLARHIAVHGTKPAGTYTGEADWVQRALKEAKFR